MKRLAPVLMAGMLVFMGAGCASSTPPSAVSPTQKPTPAAQPEPKPVSESPNPSVSAKTETSVSMGAQNGSGESGTTTLTALTEGKTKVVISVAGAPKGSSQPAHIHLGSCPTPGTVLYPLNAVVDGKSETTLNAPLATILSAGATLSVNVHKSATDLSSYVSCGDIQK